jgi:hypothetical protein
MKNFRIIGLSISIVLALSSCSEDDPTFDKPVLNIGTTYPGANFENNAAEEISLVNNQNSLASLAKSVRTPGVSVTKAELMSLFNNISNKTTNHMIEVLTSSDGYFQSLEDASSGATFIPGDLNSEGGFLSGRVFNEQGVEPDEIVDKGLYGGTLYNAAIPIMSGDISVSDVDKLVALFGANPDFPNSGSSNVSNPDIKMANYAARRDKNDGNGLYTQFKTAAIKLKTYAEAGAAYNDEKAQALTDLKTAWEKANAATVINYCHAAISTLSSTNLSDADIASGLHSYSEGLGFMDGWRTIPQNHKQITDSQIDEILVLMNAPYGQPATSYTFVTDAVNQLPKLQTVISRLQSIYSFSNQDIEDFRKNWVTEQGR